MSDTQLFHQIVISNSDRTIKPPNYENIKNYFPKCKHKVWNSKKIKNFMEHNQDFEVIEAFEKVKPFSFKADLAKFYILYHLGGWYSDLKIFFIDDIPNVDGLDIVVFRDEGDSSETGTWSIAPGLFFSKQKNPILMSAFKKCIKQISEEYYGPHPLFVTGPPVFGAAAAEDYALAYQKSLIGSFSKKLDDKKSFYVEDRKLALYKPDMNNIRDIFIPGGNNYEVMWHEKDIYN